MTRPDSFWKPVILRAVRARILRDNRGGQCSFGHGSYWLVTVMKFSAYSTLLCFFSVGLCGLAGASTVVRTYPIQAWPTPIPVQKFNPAFGTLTSITVRYVAEADAAIGVEERSTEPPAGPGSIFAGTVVGFADGIIAFPNGYSLGGRLQLIDRYGYALPAYDGVMDFSGASGTVFTAHKQVKGQFTLPEAAQMAQMVGSGTVDLRFSYDLLVNVRRASRFDNLSFLPSASNVSGSLKVTYNYTK